MVLTIHHLAFPLHWLFCSKHGRYHTTKADLLLCMLTQLQTAFLREGIDITQLPWTMDSAYVAQFAHFKAVLLKQYKALYRALKKSPTTPEFAAAAGSE